MNVCNNKFVDTRIIYPTDFSVPNFKKHLNKIYDEPAVLEKFSRVKICQALPHLKDCCSPQSSYERFRDTVQNSLVVENFYDKGFTAQDIKVFRQQVDVFYQYIDHFEKNATRLPFSEFTHENLLALLACDGLLKSKKDIAKMYVMKLLEAPVERFETLRHWYVSTPHLELILEHCPLKLEKIERLMELVHPSTLVSSDFRDLLIPKYLTHNEYAKVIQKLFDSEYTDHLITAWITTSERQDFSAIPLAYYCFNSKKLVEKLRALLSFEMKNQQIMYSSKNLGEFSTYFEAGLKDAQASADFKQYLEKKLEKEQSLLAPFSYEKGTLLTCGSPNAYLNSDFESKFDLYFDVCKEAPSVLLGVLNLKNTLKFEPKFKDSAAVKEQLKNQLTLTPKFIFDTKYVEENKEDMAKLVKHFESEKNPVIQERINKISLNIDRSLLIKV